MCLLLIMISSLPLGFYHCREVWSYLRVLCGLVELFGLGPRWRLCVCYSRATDRFHVCADAPGIRDEVMACLHQLHHLHLALLLYCSVLEPLPTPVEQPRRVLHLGRCADHHYCLRLHAPCQRHPLCHKRGRLADLDKLYRVL